MASFIFGENKLPHPLIVCKKLCRNYLLLAEGIQKDTAKGVWQIKVLQEFKNHPFLKKCLREGIRITMSDNEIVYIRTRCFLFIRYTRIFIDKYELKGKRFSKNKITI